MFLHVFYALVSYHYYLLLLLHFFCCVDLFVCAHCVSLSNVCVCVLFYFLLGKLNCVWMCMPCCCYWNSYACVFFLLFLWLNVLYVCGLVCFHSVMSFYVVLAFLAIKRRSQSCQWLVEKNLYFRYEHSTFYVAEQNNIKINKILHQTKLNEQFFFFNIVKFYFV